MVRIQTASRLHFGLLSLAADGTRWPGRAGDAAVPARRFGGVGLMVDRPGVRLRAEPARDWSATGPLAERALAFAHQFATGLRATGIALTPCRLEVEAAAPEHAGLGTGTQLGLAVGRCLAAASGLEMSVAEVARHVGRGLRSAIGIHGFARGGFLVEGGQARAGCTSPLVAHCPFPADWRVVLARPTGATGTHGAEERSALAGLTAPTAATDALSRLVLLGLLPALAEQDVDAFGEALFDFNARAGEAFAPFQGGVYASPAVANLVAFLRQSGVRGVGQSSWGPTVFAVVDGDARAGDVVRAVRDRFGAGTDVLATRAADAGARLDGTGDPC